LALQNLKKLRKETSIINIARIEMKKINNEGTNARRNGGQLAEHEHEGKKERNRLRGERDIYMAPHESREHSRHRTANIRRLPHAVPGTKKRTNASLLTPCPRPEEGKT
jgi:hypothetical protein